MELDTLSDSELQSVYEQAGKLLESRKKERQRAVIEEARAKLAEAGLTLRDLAKFPKAGKSKKDAAPVALTNPDNPSQKWTRGRGRPPAWAKKLLDSAES